MYTKKKFRTLSPYTFFEVKHLPTFASFICYHMSNIDHRYDVTETPDQHAITYLFFSEGQNEAVLKIIQFAYVRNFYNKPIFNLGLGDFDTNTGEVNDESITDNGDVYRIFNTVLSTIPRFFERNSDAGLIVMGSDGRTDFEAKCKQSCTRKCAGFCHNFNRRMKLYCNYISRKFHLFETDYQFLGGIGNNANRLDFEEFRPGKLYDGIIVFKKNV